jgi:hypothetical protein
MELKNLLQELGDCTGYKEFQSQNGDAYFSAGFIIFDLAQETEKIQLDFFIPSKKKVASFEFPFGEPKLHEDHIESMAKQIVELKVDIDDIITMCKEIIFEQNFKMKPAKIIAILRDNQWNLTCLDNVLGIVRIRIDAITASVVSSEKGSLMDFMGFRQA